MQGEVLIPGEIVWVSEQETLVDSRDNTIQFQAKALYLFLLFSSCPISSLSPRICLGK